MTSCSVCQDIASNLRYYGASSVCLSCRVFFRRTVVSKHQYDCINGKSACTVSKETRARCKSCRYKKCISVGFLPCLVNSSDRKPYSKKKTSTLEDLKITPKQPVRHIVKMDSTLKQRQLSFDYFDEEYLKKTCASIYDDDNHYDIFERKISSSILDCIKQVIDKKLIIHVPSNLYEIIAESRGNFIQTTLKHFLPNVEDKVILAMTKSVQSTTSGLEHCSYQCFKYKNLLDQAENALFFPSKKHSKFYHDLPVNAEEIEPITHEKIDTYISPYAKSQEEEELVSTTMEKTRSLLHGDVQLSHLLNMLALFSPVKVDMSMNDTCSLKFFQEKITMMIYTHLMKRTGNIDSLTIMTNLVSMMADFNTVGKVIAESIIKNDEDAVDLDHINIDHYN